MKYWSTTVGLSFFLATSLVGRAQNGNNGFEVVRIATAANPKCINSKTDEITLSVYRVTVEKKGGFFTSDQQAGIAVFATVNGNSIQLSPPGQAANVSATTPQVSLLQIAGEQKGQVFLPLEYPIASRFLLSQSNTQTKTETTSMQVAMYLEKVRGANTFGTIVQDAGTIIKALPIPASPYLTAANAFLNFANTAIQDDAKNSANAKLFANINIPFADQDFPDVQSCTNGGGSSTGAIAVLAATGSSGGNLLGLGNLSQRFCWRYRTDPTFEIQYASKPASGCAANIAESEWNEPSNDYTMLLLTAVKSPASSGNLALSDLRLASDWVRDLGNSQKLCDSLKADPTLCGVINLSRAH